MTRSDNFSGFAYISLNLVSLHISSTFKSMNFCVESTNGWMIVITTILGDCILHFKRKGVTFGGLPIAFCKVGTK